jgi:hypothetical protein
VRTCVKCKKDLPDEAFHLASDGKRHPRCKACRTAYERKRRKQKKDDRLDQIERDAVDVFCKAARLGGGNIPHSAELLETLLDYMGGTRGFANLFMKQYYDSPPGGAFRTKQLETIVRLVTNNAAMGGAKKPLTLWSEEELEDELRVRLIETAATLRTITVEALPEVREEAPAQDP